MIFRKAREKRYIKNNVKVSIDELIANLSKISKGSQEIILTPQPTGNSWRGVYNGAIAFLPEATFAIPQYFSTSVYSNAELNKICEAILDLGFKKIIFSGYVPYFKDIILALNMFKKKLNKKADLYIIYHGSFATNSEDNYTNLWLKEILQLNIDGFVEKIGFAKKGMSETFEKISGVNAYYIIPQTKIINKQSHYPGIMKSELNIGVLTHDLYRKNLHNQVAAGLMFKDAKVHIRKNYGFDYLFSNDRLVIHDYFESYDDFLMLSGSMDINFYVSFSECYGLVITESLSVGVPCLASYNSGMFDYSDELRNLLIVRDYDNSNSIYEQAKIVLENNERIGELSIKYMTELNKVSMDKFVNFIK